MHGFNVGGKWLKVTLKKGEDHLLPPTLQSVYQRASGKIDGKFGFIDSLTAHDYSKLLCIVDQTSSPTQHQTNYRHPSTSATSTPQAAENGESTTDTKQSSAFEIP